MIALFARHKVAANLLMMIVFLAGLWGLSKLNTQFLPTFNIQIITVTVNWPGASAEDVESSITRPIEDRLRSVDHVKKLTAVSGKGRSFIVIEFKANTHMSDALQQVTNLVSAVPNLPQNSKKPIITKFEEYEAMAKVLLYTDDDVSALHHWAYKFERQLLDRGIAKVSIQGIAKKEIRIGVAPEQLNALGMSLNKLSDMIGEQSEDISAGTVGVSGSGRSVRATGQKRTDRGYRDLPIISGDMGQLTQLLNVAKVSEQTQDYPKLIYYKGHPAINLTLFRTPSSDALQSAEILHDWSDQVLPTLPKGVHVHIYNESWQLIKERIMLLVKNGLGGLILIFVLLFVFLNYRVAWWTALGIPISIAATLFFMEITGGSINMVSLFALILSFGIIVDDTIVVAEEGVTQFERHGKSPLDAAIIGAKRMKIAVFAASLSTVAAFAPLLFLGGIYGQIMIAIPQVVICVILASLVEAFLILPNHTKKSFGHIRQARALKYRQAIDEWFNRVRDVHFRKFVTLAMHYGWVTLAIALSLMILAAGIIMSGRLNFSFFPTPDGKTLMADVSFVGGTSTKNIVTFLRHAEDAAWKVSKEMGKPGKPLVKTIVLLQHDSTDHHETRSQQRLGALWVELRSPALRDVTNAEFIEAWRNAIQLTPDVDKIKIRSPRADDSGADIDIALSGKSLGELKQAALALANKIKGYSGTYNIEDNLPYAPDEFVFSLKPEALVLGMNLTDIGKQVRAAYAGDLVEIFNRGKQEIDVRVRLEKDASRSLSSLQTLPIVTKKGKVLPLNALANITTQRNFDSISRTDFTTAVHVKAEVNPAMGNTNKIVAALKKDVLPQLGQQFGVQFAFKGRLLDREQTLNEMKVAILFTVALIYIILAWVSGSYLWPVFVMVAIPLGLVGAIVGHIVLGLNLTLMSLFGFFGLTGIVINDSIILLLRYKELKENGFHGNEAIVEACCQRFRAVILTSLTTIAGLSPLLFERSLQAQFLIPMAASICFGLAFATLLILVVIPTLLSMTDKPYASHTMSP
ncbi:MAG: efflux RND transporter permease subunit [Coxiellaceae bacterium]|nr:efflux RND transporter permease subunit [Coxiellaceae bacterium]